VKTIKLAFITIGTALATPSCTPTHHDMDGQPAKLGDFSYQAPAGWTQTKSKGWHSVSTTWTPDNNDQKESIVVIRTQIDSALGQAGAEAIKKKLLAAQRELPQVQVLGSPIDFHSDGGFAGVRVEDNFIPAGAKYQYHRTHAVLVEGTDIIHVLYTAEQPDAEERALHLVVNSLHKSEG
jgi:hypothetical protein